MINSQLIWTKGIVAKPKMTYESLSVLYNETREDIFGDHMVFALSCTNDFRYPKLDQGFLHKLDVHATPSLSNAKLEITHETSPGLGASSQIIDVHKDLKVSCFDNGSIIRITNFGPKKTFNSDVRNRLHHHVAPINCLAASSSGTFIATGTVDGEIGLYQAKGVDMMFLARRHVAPAMITGLSFVTTTSCGPKNPGVSNDDNLVIYCTHDGYVGMIDRRCRFGSRSGHKIVHVTEPRLNLTSLCSMSELAGQHVVFMGSKHGHIVAIDMRSSNKLLLETKQAGDGCVRRLKEVVVPSVSGSKSFLAYTNGTEAIKILDSKTLLPDQGWKADRLPESRQHDLCQVNDRIITCGDDLSIGCWTWDY